MSWLSDNLNFEKFNLGKITHNLLSNPLQTALGAEDPASTKVWNTLLGQNWQPSVDQMGGPTGHTFQEANRAGINTGPASAVHDVAHAIATYEALGGAGNAAFSGDEVGGAGGADSAGLGADGAGGVGGGAGGGAGGGVGSSLGGAGSGSGGSSFDWQQFMGGGGGGGDQTSPGQPTAQQQALSANEQLLQTRQLIAQLLAQQQQ